MIMISPKKAAAQVSELTGRVVTEATVRRWCRNGLGCHVAGRWCLPESASYMLPKMPGKAADGGKCQ
jgi:hypothetical protein